MIEIVNFFIQLLIFLFAFSFPFNNFLLKKIGFRISTIYEIFSLILFFFQQFV